MPNSYSLRICSNSSPSLSSPSQASCLFRRMLRSCGGGVGSPRRLLPEAPTDPDARISRIRLFGPRFRYVTGEVRRRGCGSGYRSSSRFIFARDIHARCERRLRLRGQAGSTEKPAMTTAMHARGASRSDGNSTTRGVVRTALPPRKGSVRSCTRLCSRFWRGLGVRRRGDQQRLMHAIHQSEPAPVASIRGVTHRAREWADWAVFFPR